MQFFLCILLYEKMLIASTYTKMERVFTTIFQYIFKN